MDLRQLRLCIRMVGSSGVNAPRSSLHHFPTTTTISTSRSSAPSAPAPPPGPQREGGRGGRGGVIGPSQPELRLVPEYQMWRRTRKVSCLCFVKCALTKYGLRRDTPSSSATTSLPPSYPPRRTPTPHPCINLRHHLQRKRLNRRSRRLPHSLDLLINFT